MPPSAVALDPRLQEIGQLVADAAKQFADPKNTVPADDIAKKLANDITNVVAPGNQPSSLVGAMNQAIADPGLARALGAYMGVFGAALNLSWSGVTNQHPHYHHCHQSFTSALLNFVAPQATQAFSDAFNDFTQSAFGIKGNFRPW